MAKKKELTKEDKINKEVERLTRIYCDVDKGNKNIVEGLIKRAAFMLIQLEEYEMDLLTNGYIEMFTQSEKTSPYERERPTARLYSTLQKNYATTIKQLSDMLPKPKKQTGQDQDDFDDFVSDRDD